MDPSEKTRVGVAGGERKDMRVKRGDQIRGTPSPRLPGSGGTRGARPRERDAHGWSRAVISLSTQISSRAWGRDRKSSQSRGSSSECRIAWGLLQACMHGDHGRGDGRSQAETRARTGRRIGGGRLARAARVADFSCGVRRWTAVSISIQPLEPVEGYKTYGPCHCGRDISRRPDSVLELLDQVVRLMPGSRRPGFLTPPASSRASSNRRSSIDPENP